MNEETNKTIHYIVYKITNKINGKIYVGQHQTKNLNDGYMGSSAVLKAAIKKYGLENFTKEIIRECSSHEEMNDLEAEIVNHDFVARKDTYNLSVGGTCGWENCNKIFRNDPERERLRQLHAVERLREVCKTEEHRKKLSEAGKKYYETHVGTFLGKKHSEEVKAKIREAASIYQKGDRNSNFGKHWYKDPNDKTKSHPYHDGEQPEGWVRGKWMYEKEIAAQTKDREKRKYITNGIQNRLIPIEEKIPTGWRLGRAFIKNPMKGKKWITNGIDYKLIDKDFQIPDGWHPGMK